MFDELAFNVEGWSSSSLEEEPAGQVCTDLLLIVVSTIAMPFPCTKIPVMYLKIKRLKTSVLSLSSKPCSSEARARVVTG